MDKIACFDDELVRELRALRRRGLAQSDGLQLVLLREQARRVLLMDSEAATITRADLTKLLRAAVAKMDGGSLAECIEILFGLVPSLRGLRPTELRRLATEKFYNDSGPDNVDAFRKKYEDRRIFPELAVVIQELGTRRESIAESGVVGSPQSTKSILISKLGEVYKRLVDESLRFLSPRYFEHSTADRSRLVMDWIAVRRQLVDTYAQLLKTIEAEITLEPPKANADIDPRIRNKVSLLQHVEPLVTTVWSPFDELPENPFDELEVNQRSYG